MRKRVQVDDLQTAIASCLGEDQGIHKYVPRYSKRFPLRKQRTTCGICSNNESFILHSKIMIDLIGLD